MNQEVAASKFDLVKGMRLHLVGIGGTGMSAIAQVLLDRDYHVSGSDLNLNEKIKSLRDRGAEVFIGHKSENVTGVDAVILSSAIPENNPEWLAAREANLPILKRSDFLRHLMAGQIGIAVAGTHGKTTTTAMIVQILLDSGNDPSVILGGDLPVLKGSGRSGDGDYFIVEADEYDHMFLGLRPEIAVITNIDHDHPDIFPTLAEYLDAFCEFVALIPEHGRLIVSGEDPGIGDMVSEVKSAAVDTITYGLAEDSAAVPEFDLLAVNSRPNQLGGTDFVLMANDQTVGLVRLRVPGLHNVQNALAAIAIALELEIDFGQICRSLAEFGGVGRRFQLIGEAGGLTVIDDYAHHPTEIKATLSAARQRFGDRRIWAVWQPHTYSRTRLLLPKFSTSFADADRVVALDIYRSRENDTLGMDPAEFIMDMQHPSAVHTGEIEETIAYLLDRARPGDVVLTLGAGDGNLVGIGLLEALRIRVETFRS